MLDRGLANRPGSQLTVNCSELPTVKQKQKGKNLYSIPDLLNAISAPSALARFDVWLSIQYVAPTCLTLTSALGGQWLASVGERTSRGEQSPAGGGTSSGHS